MLGTIRMDCNMAVGNQQKHLSLHLPQKGKFISGGTQEQENNTFADT